VVRDIIPGRGIPPRGVGRRSRPIRHPARVRPVRPVLCAGRL